MLLTCVALLSCVERSALFHNVVQEKCVENPADVQSGTGPSLLTVYIRYLCSETCEVF